MFDRTRHSPEVRKAMRAAMEIMPSSGDVQDLLTSLSRARERNITILSAPLDSAISGLLISTEQADYIAVSDGASPERFVAIVCHEVAHALLGHDHSHAIGEEILETGLLQIVNPELAGSAVAARRAYAHTDESEAEVVATYLSVELRRRVMRGGHTFYDERWR